MVSFSSSLSPLSCIYLHHHKDFLTFVTQVVQVLRAIDRDRAEQDTPIHFSVPPESSSALNLTIRETGGARRRPSLLLVLLSNAVHHV